MRFLKWAVVGLVLLAVGAWFAASIAIGRGAEAALAALRENGIRAETSDLSVGGFPTRLELRLADVVISDPVSGAGWQGASLVLHAASWAPWRVTADLPPEQVLTLPTGRFTLRSVGLAATLGSAPALSLPLRLAEAGAASLTVAADAGWSLATGEIAVRLAADPAHPPGSYALTFDLAPLAPDAGFLARLRDISLPGLPPPDLPAEVETLSGRIGLRFTAPILLAGDGPPPLDGIEVDTADLAWGALVLHAEGTLAADAEGRAVGRIMLRVRGWDRLPALLVAAGAVKPEVAPTVGNALKALAGESPDPAVLALPLEMADGWMRLGPLPLGEAPRLR